VTEHGVLPGLWPIHGDGVLARQGDLVLLIHPAGGAFTDRLLDLLGEAARAGANGLRFTDMVSAQFDADAVAADAATDQQGPAVVAFGPVGGGTAVAVYGTGWAEVTTSRGSQRLTAGEPYGRLHCVLPSTLIKVRAGVQAVVGDSETDPYLRLADGVVRAVALLYAPAEVRGEPADQPAPAAPGPDLAADVSPAVPAAVPPPPARPAVPAAVAPPPAPPAVPTPPPAPPAPEVVPEPVQQVPEPQVQQVPEPHADHIEAPEPAYYATQIEPAVAKPSVPDPYAAAPPPPPPPVPDPYAAAPPPPPAPPPRPAAPDPYAAQVADPYLAPPDLRAAQPPQPTPGLAAGPPEGGPQQNFISISLLADQADNEMPQRDPLPLGAEAPDAKKLGLIEMPVTPVEGVYCKNGHFNDPEARYCAVCGISMGQLTKVRQQGPRPPLGVLILSDGSVCQLDADYVIGREPTLDSSVADGRARPLRLIGAAGVVSRIHARVDLDGWQVFLTDLNSANGTQVLMPGERNPTNLQPGVRTPLMAGAQIRLGGEYVVQYDSHRHR
jgi:FHA domain